MENESAELVSSPEKEELQDTKDQELQTLESVSDESDVPDENDDTSTNEGDSESDSDIDPAVTKIVGKLLDMMHNEGLDSMAGEYEGLADVLERTKGLALEADEIHKAILETKRLQREMETVERQIGLSDGNLPRGKAAHRRDEAKDAVPYSLTPDTLDILYGELAASLDFISAMLETQDNPEVLEAGGEYTEHRQRALNAINALQEQGADPRAAVFSQYRLNAWLTLQLEGMTGSSTLSLRQAKQIMKNALLKYREQFEQRELWLEKPNQNDPPILDGLIREVDRAQKAIGERIDRFPEIFTGEDRELLQKFLPAIDEYCKEVTRFGVSGAKSYVSLPSELLEVQEKVSQSREFGTVIDASKRLPKGMHRLYLLHWACESVLQEVSRTAREVKSYLPPGTKAFAGRILTAIQKSHSEDRNLKNLRWAINFRNSIAHEGKIWDPESFDKHVGGYQRGIDRLCDLYKINLEELKVHKPQHPKPIKEYISRLEQKMLMENIEAEHYYSLISREDTENHLKHFINRHDTVEDKDIGYFLWRERTNFVSKEYFQMDSRRVETALDKWAKSNQHRSAQMGGNVGKRFYRWVVDGVFKEPNSNRTRENINEATRAVRESGNVN